MCKLFVLLLMYLVTSTLVSKCECDDFPSLLTANASIAVILDREYLDNDERYEDILKEVKVIIERVLREDLKNGGLIITYYSWTKINLKKDFTAVLSVTNCENTWEIYKDSRSEDLLMLALTDSDCPRLPKNEAIMIPMMKPGEELPQVILDARAQHSLDWKSAILLYDETFDRDMISRCVIALSRDFPIVSGDIVRPLSVSIYRIKESAHEWDRKKFIRNLLKSLPTKFIGQNFLVLVTSKLMYNVMEISRDLKMVSTGAQWLYVVSDTDYVNSNFSAVMPLIEEGNNVAFIHNYTKGGDECYTGLKCHTNEILKSFVLGLSKAIREENAIYGQISDEEWEIIRPSKKERRDGILDFMEENLESVSKCSKCLSWNVKTAEIWGEKYRSTSFADDDAALKNKMKGPSFQLLQPGVWKPSGLIMSDVLFPHISHGFRGKIFHIITYHNPPWQVITTNGTGVVSTSTGIIIDVLNEMSKKLNFTYVLHPATTTATISQNLSMDSNESAYRSVHLTTDIPLEVLNLLTENRIILGAVASTVNERYKSLVNFSVPISIQPYSFLVAKPKEISRIYLFTAPFTRGTWLCLAASIVLLPPVLCLVNRYSPYYEYHGKSKKLGLFKIDNCFWYIYGALLQQGGLYLPHADSGRIIIGSWWLLVIVLVTTYCGNLVAFLTFPKIDVQVKTISELVKARGNMDWSMRSGTYLEEYIKETDIEKYQILFQNAKFHLDENEEIIENVRNGKHVYIDWRSNLQYIMRREHLKTDTCDFALSMEDFMEEQISMVLPKNSPYLDLFNEEITRLHQMGLIERWRKQYLPVRDRCTKQSSLIEVVNHTVNLNDMQGCFILLMMGFAGGIVFLLFECVIRKYLNRKRRLGLERERQKSLIEFTN